MADQNKETVMGVVTEALPNTFFRVKLEDQSEILTYLAGKMRMNRIRVLEPYGGKGRIIQRM